MRLHYVKQLATTPKRFLNPGVKKAVGAKNKYWKTGQVIDIYFIGGNEAQKNLVKEVYREIETFVNLKFNFTTDPSISELRISFVEDFTSWSYEGTDARFISKAAATMNLGWLLDDPTDIGTVRHEAFHSIGAVHEHNWGDIIYDKECMYAKYERIGWGRQTVDDNVLNHRHDVDKSEKRDAEGIMHYPMRWELDCILNADELDLPLNFNDEFSQEDKRFWSEIYPYETTDVTDSTDEFSSMYKEALKLIYDNERNAIKMSKKINKGVAELFGLDTKGYEKTLVNRINMFLKQ